MFEAYEEVKSPFPKAPGEYKQSLKAWENKVYNPATKDFEPVSDAHFEQLIRGNAHYLAIEMLGGPNGLAKDEERPLYLSFAKWDETKGEATNRGTTFFYRPDRGSSGSRNFVVVPTPIQHYKVVNFIANRLRPERFSSTRDLTEFVTSTLSLQGVARLLDRKDIDNKVKRDIFVATVAAAYAEGSRFSDYQVERFYDRAGSFYDRKGLLIELLSNGVNPKSAVKISQLSTGQNFTNGELLQVLEGFIGHVAPANYRSNGSRQVNTVNLLTNAIAKVRDATEHKSDIADQVDLVIANSIADFVRDRKGHFNAEDTRNLTALIDQLSESSREHFLTRLHTVSREYLDTARYTCGREEQANLPGRQSVLLGLHLSKGKVDFLEAQDHEEDRLSILYRVFSDYELLPVVIDSDDPIRDIDLLIEKFKRAYLDPRKSAPFEDIFKKEGYYFADHITDQHRQYLALELTKRIIETYDRAYTGEAPYDTRGIEVFISAYGRDIFCPIRHTDNREFNAAVIDELYARADVPAKFLLAEAGLLDSDRTQQAVIDYSNWRFGVNGATAVATLVAARAAGSKDDFTRVVNATERFGVEI